jgi:hypothetical protein
MLRANCTHDDFDRDLVFEVFLAKDFSKKTIDAGVSLFLYRVFPNTSHRTPAGRMSETGKRYRTQLPLDLHFLLTAWGKDASLQHKIAGWMMRTLEDSPILPAGLLNAIGPEVFRPDETVEIILGQLDTEVLVRIWDMLLENSYQLSVPYVARDVRIESEKFLTQGPPVQERTFEYVEGGVEAPSP